MFVRRNDHSIALDSRLARNLRGIRCAVLALVAGCGSRADLADTDAPIPECVTYQQTLASCLGRKLDLPLAAETYPHNPTERSSMQIFCRANLGRIQTLCRP